MADDLGHALLYVDVRPIRIAYAIAAGSEEDFRTSIEEASSHWGGIQELILPVAQDGRILEYWMPVLDLAPPDYICAVSSFHEWRDPLLEQTGREVVNLEHIQQHSALHATAVQPLEVGPSNVIGARREDPLASLAALGVAGDTEQLTAWQSVGLTVFQQPIGQLQLAGAQLNESSLIAATGRQCGETAVYGISGGPLLVWLSETNSLEDALHFWNTRVSSHREV